MLTCYGREKLLQALASRSFGTKGDSEHIAAEKEQEQIEKAESRM
jgi:hypothetical protein